jgi:hypothetical protein
LLLLAFPLDGLVGDDCTLPVPVPYARLFRKATFDWTSEENESRVRERSFSLAKLGSEGDIGMRC